MRGLGGACAYYFSFTMGYFETVIFRGRRLLCADDTLGIGRSAGRVRARVEFRLERASVVWADREMGGSFGHGAQKESGGVMRESWGLCAWPRGPRREKSIHVFTRDKNKGNNVDTDSEMRNKAHEKKKKE